MTRKDYFAETIQLTRSLVEQFYGRNPGSFLPLLHPDVVWIGAADHQYFRGRENVAKQLKLLTAAPPCKIGKVTFDFMILDVSTCMVTGQYLAETVPESGEILAAIQRVTFIWKKTENTFQIIHMHVSNPLEIQNTDESFPHRAGIQTYEYLQRILKKQRILTNPLVLCGKNAETFFIQPEDILYIEAVNINCIVHCNSRNPLVCLPMARLIEQLPDYFVRIHRSYIVNPHHISEIHRCYVIIENGDRLPIPEKKYKEIRNLLKNHSHIR